MDEEIHLQVKLNYSIVEDDAGEEERFVKSKQRKNENANDHASAVPWHHNGQAQPEAGIGQNLGDEM